MAQATTPSQTTAARRMPDRNLALDLLRVTEAAAMAAGRWVGRRDKDGADAAAVAAMRAMMGSVPMDGVVVIGEGEKDDAPMLYNGERVGSGAGTACDVAVDPIDGTTLTSKGMGDAVSVLAVAPRGAMYDPSAVFYMDKLVADPDAVGVVDLRQSPEDNVAALARAKGCAPEDITVCMLDRPRHDELSQRVINTGARIKFITDGDVGAAVLAATVDSGVDLLLGIGGTPEGVITACAIQCLGGVLQGRLHPRSDEERRRADEASLDLDAVLTADDLVSGDDAFFVMTGITDGELLHGVRYGRNRAITESLVMRSRSGTVRQVRSTHHLDKLDLYSIVDYRHAGGRA
ncbi:MAG TPA: class II fructose-bisphosphatase [Pseudonocardiaceae bacterium]|nr:class II fructose-bisphosphatase [Pseudonocardiaceae bacterium]